jgi:formylglycine-generating enzyme required for sulfatase activity
MVRAVSQAGRIPQGYISGDLAEKACAASGKRLCSPREWRTACKGPERMRYGYSNANEPRRCNDYGRGPVTLLFGRQFDPGNQKEWTFERMNAPELNQVSGTLSPTGAHPDCTNGFGVYDMVGNLHEWVSDPEGTFQGGYYQDTHINGEGCDYTTKAHNFTYQDYSTGFRCCADATP